MSLPDRDNDDRLAEEIVRRHADTLGAGPLVLDPVRTARIETKGDGVDDAPSKYIFRDSAGAPRVFLAVSPPAFPTAMADWVRPAQQIHARLTPAAAEAVALPLVTGETADARSYAIWPYFAPWSSRRLARALQVGWWSKEVVGWLSALANETREPLETVDARADALWTPLEYLTGAEGVPPHIQRLARRTMEQARASDTAHVCVAHHGDFWSGNIMRAHRRDRTGTALRVIDWGAARATGVPYYDLVRFIETSPAGVRQVIGPWAMRRYARATGLPKELAPLYLLAGLGRLGLEPGEFPMPRYVALVERQVAILAWLYPQMRRLYA